MKNVQVIDRANNCEYSIFAATNKEFEAIFPDAQDIEFVENFIERVGESVAAEITEAMWKRPVNKKAAHGIHGTLFYQLIEKERYYPTKKESEMVPLGIADLGATHGPTADSRRPGEIARKQSLVNCSLDMHRT